MRSHVFENKILEIFRTQIKSVNVRSSVVNSVVFSTGFQAASHPRVQNNNDTMMMKLIYVVVAVVVVVVVVVVSRFFRLCIEYD
jgi:hypothetical protein